MRFFEVIEEAAALQVGGLPDQGEVSSSESGPSWSNSAQGVSVEMTRSDCNEKKIRDK